VRWPIEPGPDYIYTRFGCDCIGVPRNQQKKQARRSPVPTNGGALHEAPALTNERSSDGTRFGDCWISSFRQFSDLNAGGWVINAMTHANYWLR
jgi:hypothetical protein